MTYDEMDAPALRAEVATLREALALESQRLALWRVLSRLRYAEGCGLLTPKGVRKVCNALEVETTRAYNRARRRLGVPFKAEDTPEREAVRARFLAAMAAEPGFEAALALLEASTCNRSMHEVVSLPPTRSDA